jgi:cell wall-associated NlpC family hydrolase
MTTRADIVADARSYLGVKWRHQGRTHKGIDCVGLVACIAHGRGISDYDNTNYGRSALTFDFLRVFRAHMDEVPVGQEQDGDVLVFIERARPCHAGLATTRHGARHFVHASAADRQVLEEQYDEDWRARTRAVFRFRGLED